MIAPLLLAALGFDCPATPVRTQPYAGEQAGLRGVPWIATTNGG